MQSAEGARSRDAYLKWVIAHLFGEAGSAHYNGLQAHPTWRAFHGTTILGASPSPEWQHMLELSLSENGVRNVLLIGGGDPFRTQGFHNSVLGAVGRGLWRQRPFRLVSLDIEHRPKGGSKRHVQSADEQVVFYTAWADNTQLDLDCPIVRWLTHLDGEEETGMYDLILLKNSLCACEEERREAFGFLAGMIQAGNLLTGSVDKTCGGFAYKGPEGLSVFRRFLEVVKSLLSAQGMAIIVNDNGKPIPDLLTSELSSSDPRYGGWEEISGPGCAESLGWRGQNDRTLWVFTKGAWVA